MKLLNSKVKRFALGLILVGTAVACGELMMNNPESGSALQAFSFSGTAEPITPEQLKQTKLAQYLSNPELCASFMNESVKIGLWAGYTDNENKWGRARGDCKAEGDGIYCKQDTGVYFEKGGSAMGMEIPGVLELKSTAKYTCMGAGRAVGLISGAAIDSSVASSGDISTVSIDHVKDLKSDIVNRQASYSDAYVISVVNENKESGKKQYVKYYFAGDGRPIGSRNSQEQNFNEIVQRQTGEYHFLYPNEASPLGEPAL